MGNTSKSANSQYWQGRRVFVTGCSGLLGSLLTRELVDRGADVVGLMRDWVPSSRLVSDGTVNKMTLVRGDIEDIEVLERALSEY